MVPMKVFQILPLHPIAIDKGSIPYISSPLQPSDHPEEGEVVEALIPPGSGEG